MGPSKMAAIEISWLHFSNNRSSIQSFLEISDRYIHFGLDLKSSKSFHYWAVDRIIAFPEYVNALKVSSLKANSFLGLYINYYYTLSLLMPLKYGKS